MPVTEHHIASVYSLILPSNDIFDMYIDMIIVYSIKDLIKKVKYKTTTLTSLEKKIKLDFK